MNDVEMKSANLDTFFKEKFIEMIFDLGVYTLKEIGYYCMN